MGRNVEDVAGKIPFAANSQGQEGDRGLELKTRARHDARRDTR